MAALMRVGFVGIGRIGSLHADPARGEGRRVAVAEVRR
jgi:prephenate dehydrogenase